MLVMMFNSFIQPITRQSIYKSVNLLFCWVLLRKGFQDTNNLITNIF